MVLKFFSRDKVEDRAHYLIDRSRVMGAIGSDVLFSARKGHLLSLREGQPEENTTGYSIGIGLRTIDSQGRQGIAYVSSMEKDDLDSLLNWSWNNCRVSEPDPDICLYDGPSPSYDLEMEDPEIEKIDPEYRMEVCSRMTEIARSADPRVESVRSASWADGQGEILYLSSSGFSGWYRGSSASCGVAVVLKGEKGMEMGGYGDESRLLASLNPCEISSQAVQRTLAILDGTPLPTGKYDLLLDPETTASFIEVLGELFLAPNIHKNKSLLKKSLGKKIAAGSVTLIDDGTIPWGAASSPFDGEGYPTTRTVILEDGVVQSYLYNLKYAKIDGVVSTGNAARGISSLPDVDISNLYIVPGTESHDNIVSSAGKAIYVLELLGLHTIDPVSGDFSLGIKGTFIEDGKFRSPVSGMTIAGNILELLDKIDIIGNDLRFFGNIGGCTLVVRDVAAAGL